MTNTPYSNRLHVGIFGETNVGKSYLFNALIGSDSAIVSDRPGTTTDPVQKPMELIPFGPIVLIDTAGLGDDSPLGRQRMEKTLKVLDRVDLALYVMKSPATEDPDSQAAYKDFTAYLNDKNILHISVTRDDDIETLKKAMVQHLSSIKTEDDTMLWGLLPPGATVLMVAPIDSAAPKGRLILPQAQLIRDCLDNNFAAHVVTEKGIKTALANLKRIDLVVTDSQVFGLVAENIPQDVKLTSFSILMARRKGGIEILLDGLNAIKYLKDGDKILISEVCTHNRTHEDIGQVQIPAALRRITGRKLDFEFAAGSDFPEDLTKYALIIHCGGCMTTRRDMKNRIGRAKKFNIPITNYGLFLAYASGILERSIEVLKVGDKLEM